MNVFAFAASAGDARRYDSPIPVQRIPEILHVDIVD